MNTYMVGGAVRDALLGLPVHDRDWVVVGSTPKAMQARGFVPVGKDFPVFLHPRTHEEHALARTERKTAPGYHGFVVHAAPDVTLEDDLARRDLTINAIAAKPMQTSAGGTFDTQNPQPDLVALVDPHGGVADLRAGVLRHVTDAFREDPVRILRVARFAARFGHFTVAPETQALMQDMVASGEVNHLVPERVWQELSRGLMAPTPSRMLQVLRDCGALKVLLPELDRLWGVPQRAEYHPEVDTGVHVMLVLDMAARLAALLVALAALVWAWALPGRSRWWLVALALLGNGWLLAVVGPYVIQPAPAHSSGEGIAAAGSVGQQRWQPWSAQRVAELSAAGQPVFVDFTAAWCVTCQYNKRTTLADTSLLADFAAHKVALLRADWTLRDPAITAALAQLGRNGVPVYVLYAQGRAPVVLTEILSVQEVRTALAAL